MILQDNQPKRQRFRRTRQPIIQPVILSLVALLFASGLASGVSAEELEPPNSPARQFDLQVQQLVQTLSQSMVTVQVASRTSPFQTAIAPRSASSAGQPIYLRNVSAVVVDSCKYLICAAALLSDQDSLWLIRDGKRYDVERAGIDYRSGLALLKTTAPNLVSVSYESQTPSTGALALFLKSSGPESVEPTLTIAGGVSTVDGYLEFNGPVGSGTVGGAFFNMDGRLLGLALGSLSPTGVSNRVFVLPVSRIEPIVTRLKCCSDRQAGYLGVQVVNTQIRGLNLAHRRSYGASQTNTNKSQVHFATDGQAPEFTSPQAKLTNGVLVTVVEENSPAQEAGIQVGDVVYKYDNQLVESVNAFRDYVRGCAPDSVISLEFLRGDQQLVVSARLSNAPLQSMAPARSQTGEANSSLPEQGGYNTLLDQIHRLEKRLQALEEDR